MLALCAPRHATLAGWAAILAAPTAIAGVCGTNFERVPELSWRYGRRAVLPVIAVARSALFVRLRRAGWI